jgi:hypothetical protein
MPGFRHCSFCYGKGCIACDAEQKKFVEAAYAAAPKWRDPDSRDVRDHWIRAEQLRGFIAGGVGLDVMTEEQVEAAFQPALDAEYDRQFPNGPQPIFTARTGNTDDLALLKTVVSSGVLREAFGPDGGGIAEIDRRASEARLTQAARQVLCPNDDDQRSA